ncbi:hypothetical protein Pmani_007303 [Petrolisthes manimaculis]|uniref:Uncharacterized protein n=1 Tax=Petrolisthes manimaculis TaxID=1843537 RepID=A0AAE1UIU6_9EUCA|nr:hypothetical protein Pmani_007303 [Petrolisthes manimaculis]
MATCPRVCRNIIRCTEILFMNINHFSASCTGGGIDEDYMTHLQRVYNILIRCRKHGITLNRDKFVSPHFCGFKNFQQGISADMMKINAATAQPLRPLMSPE